MSNTNNEPTQVTIIKRTMPENTLSIQEFVWPYESIAQELKARTGIDLEKHFIAPILHESGYTKGGLITVCEKEEDENYTYRILIDSFEIVSGYYFTEDDCFTEDEFE